MKRRKAARAGITALLAVVMAMPVSALTADVPAAVSPETAVVEAAEVEVPDPIMELDFEKGFQGETGENGLKVVEFAPRLMYEQQYSIAEDTNKWIFEWTDKPAIEGFSENDCHYVTSAVGNQPTTYDDPDMGNVFRLDSTMKIEKKVKEKSDKMDFSVPIGSVIQPELTAHSAVQIRNPFAGMDFSEEESHWKKDPANLPNGPQWQKGVTISYWVKVPQPREATETDQEDDILNDSVLFTFENIQRTDTAADPNGEKVTYQADDWAKHEAAENYKADDPQYALGTRKIIKASDGTEYIAAKDYGPLVRLNPEYEGSAAKKIYFEIKEGDSKWNSPEKIAVRTEAGKTVYLYPIGPNIYNEYKELDINKGSSVRRGYINGSLQIAASDTFHFMEDNYTAEVQSDGTWKALAGATDLNPRTAKEGELIQLRNNNLFYFQGDHTVTDAPEEWHYVTCVLKNDWVQFYVDGETIAADYFGYHGEPFSNLNGKKYFNKGFGIRYPYMLGQPWSGVPDWPADGTLSAGPSNAVAQTMLEWLSDEDTVLYLGNQGCAAKAADQEIGNLDGVLMDDIRFYDVPLTDAQAAALYEQSAAEKEKNADIPAPVLSMNFEDTEVGAIPSNMKEAESNDASGRVAVPSVVNEAQFGKVLKLHASRATTTSAVQFDNPFAGKDLTGATVSYWFRSVPDKNGDIGEGVTVTFLDEPKVLVHDKILPEVKETPTRSGLWANNSCDASFMAGVDTTINTLLKNHYQQSTKKNGNTDPTKSGYDAEAAQLEDEWNARLNSTGEWHYAAMVIKNSGIYMYFDGEKLANNLADAQGPYFYGSRFYDGYYHKYLDCFSSIRVGAGNAGATPLMTFLTQADTGAYFGLMNRQNSATTYRTTAECYLDDVSFYDVALNDEQICTLYVTAKADAAFKSAVDGIAADQPDWEAGSTTASEEFEISDTPVQTASIDGYTGTETELVIPAAINGNKITEISAGAFKDSPVTGIVLPETVTKIGAGAFAGSSLQSITITANEIEIAEDAFTGCGNVTIRCYAASKAYAFAQTHDMAVELLDVKPEVLCGDLDGSGNADANDALLILKIAAKLQTPTEEQRIAGDVDKSGNVDANDALYVLKKAAKLIDVFPAEAN